jgi:hypothetical protein
MLKERGKWLAVPNRRACLRRVRAAFGRASVQVGDKS